MSNALANVTDEMPLNGHVRTMNNQMKLLIRLLSAWSIYVFTYIMTYKGEDSILLALLLLCTILYSVLAVRKHAVQTRPRPQSMKNKWYPKL